MKFKNGLSVASLIDVSKKYFSSKITDLRDKSKIKFSLQEALMSGFAIFHLKYASMLAFENEFKKDNNATQQNLKNLYGIKEIPSDTQMRQILDDVNPKEIRELFSQIFSMLQRRDYLKEFIFFENNYLLALDGTGYFSSESIHCESCCVKHHRDGRVTYYHQFLAGALIHPQKKAVLPFAPEPILLQDGKEKNDCERNATERFLREFRKEHPHLRIIVTEDGLASNAPHIKLLKSLDFNFILGAKSGDHKYLFEQLSSAIESEKIQTLQTNDGKIIHSFRWINNVPLNNSNPDCIVNFLDYHQFKGEEDPMHFSWVTNFFLNEENVESIMRGGRARWGIENQVFNTLKNQGYHFEHNFGHGYKNLSVVMAYLMVLAFFFDQIGQLSCEIFKKILEFYETKKNLWEKMRSHFILKTFSNWEDFYEQLLKFYPSKYEIFIDSS